ncbi:hypothetical protein [Limnobacter parvus]|uniref:Uncharacterized protein n=1 Tax=Limnobacter parvus TaxID=2939690 RepID=A0ABT1XKS2_9BURK|nr:hypothetical protein [Limnobacter parvus]MCR2747896.1 hypothetical protein [Limnobacter parvus]
MLSQSPVTVGLESMDSLPGSNLIDLSLASSFIPGDLFQSIVSQIAQIDLSLFGMHNQFDPLTSALSPSCFADFFQSTSPINSSASFAEPVVAQSAEFA